MANPCWTHLVTDQDSRPQMAHLSLIYAPCFLVHFLVEGCKTLSCPCAHCTMHDESCFLVAHFTAERVMIRVIEASWHDAY